MSYCHTTEKQTQEMEQLQAQMRSREQQADQVTDRYERTVYRSIILLAFYSSSKSAHLGCIVWYLYGFICRLRKEINQKEFDIDSVKRELNSLKRKFEEQQRLEQDNKRKASTSNLKFEEMKEQMERAKGDAEALKKER